MQSTRKITYASVSNLSGGNTVFTSAETRDQLYAEFTEIEMLAKGMKPWIKKANDPSDKGYALSSGHTTLPEGDAILYFLVDKNDSGR